MSKLLKGGIVLIHGEGDKVTPTKTDVLIQEDRIVSLANDVSVPPDCEVIDCTGKIISPGFVDAHHHLWQTMLKGMYGDSQFLEYLAGSKRPFVRCRKLDKKANRHSQRIGHEIDPAGCLLGQLIRLPGGS